MSGPESDNKPKRTGRVRHEPGGRAIWEWAIDSGRHAIDSTSRLLQKLDLSSLTLLGDDDKPWKGDHPDAGPGAAGQRSKEREPVPTFGGPREHDPLAEQRKSFNPYDNRAPARRGATPQPATPPRPRITQPEAPRRKGLLAKILGRH